MERLNTNLTERTPVNSRCAKLSCSFLVNLLILIGVASSLLLNSNQAYASPIVVAHYMHSYILGDYVGPLPDDPSNLSSWPPSEFYERSCWPSSLNSMAKSGTSAETTELNLAAAAGLSAFGLLISPTNIQPISAYLPGLKNLAKAAASTSVKLLPDIWFSSNSMLTCTPTNPCDALSWAAFGQNVKNYMDAYPNSFLKSNGKWLILVSSALYSNYVTASQFSHFFDPWGGRSNFFVIESTGPWTDLNAFTASGWASSSQALSMWTGDLGWNAVQYQALLSETAVNNSPLVWPIHTAYFAFRDGNQSIQENFGITNMVDQWSHAINQRIPLVINQTWNDFSEDHAIMQTNTRGQTLVHLTRYFADWYKTLKQPTINKDRVFLFYRRQLTTTTLTSATAIATPPGCSQSPVVDYINVVSMLTKPGTLELSDGVLKMTLSAPAGYYEWLVYAPSSRSCNSVYPTANSTRAVSTVAAIPSGLPTVALKRNGTLVTSAFGPVAILNTARWQDMTMVGAESPDTNPSVPY